MPDGVLSVAVSMPTWRKTAAARLTVRDAKPPEVYSLVTQVGPPTMVEMSPGQAVLRAGGTAALHVSVRDNLALAWIGYAAGAPWHVRDSVPAGGFWAADTFDLAVPATLAGGSTSLTAFARDRSGNLAEQRFDSVGVYAVVDRPTRTAPLEAPVREAAFDPARRVLYLSQPARSQVAVLSLATMTYGPPIPLPAAPAGLDLTPSGDTLYVALARSVFLAAVGLRAATPRAALVRVRFAPNPTIVSPLTDYAMEPWVEDVRVAANGRVLVSLAQPDPGLLGNTDKLVELDPATGQQRVAFSGFGWYRLPLVARADRQTVLVPNTGGGGGDLPSVIRYSAATGAYAPPAGANANTLYPPPASGAADASAYLFGRTLFDGELRRARAFGFAGYVSDRTALAPSGAEVFAAAQYACGPFAPTPCPPETEPAAVLRYDAPSGRLTEMVPTPQFARGLLALADGRTLVAFGPTAVSVIDLRSPGAPAVAFARLGRGRPGVPPLLPRPAKRIGVQTAPDAAHVPPAPVVPVMRARFRVAAPTR
jgi:hypothetical protein